MPDATQAATFRLMSEAGYVRHPADSLSGDVWRPRGLGQEGGRVAGLETYFDHWLNAVGDPSEALRNDPNFRTKIRSHPDVRGAMNKRALTVAAFPDRIEPNPKAKDADAARKVAEAVEATWRRIPNIPLLYEQMEWAVIEGGVGFEWTWERLPSGMEVPGSFHAVHKSRFLFDRLGNLALRTRGSPVWGEYVATNPQARLSLAEALAGRSKVRVADQLVDRRRFMYHVHRLSPGTWEQPELEGFQYYGDGEETSLYHPVTFDVYALKGRVKWLERYGDPTIDVYYPENRPDAAATLAQIAEDMRNGSVITIPRMGGGDPTMEFEIKQREVPKQSYDAFASFSDGWALKRINTILLGQAEENQQNTSDGDGGGSYSSHASRKESGPDVIYKWDAGRIESTVNTQLIPHIARAQFPNLPDDYVPVLRLGAKEERDRDAEVGIVEKVVKMGAPVTKKYLYEVSQIPEPEPGEDVVGGQPQGQPGATPGQPAPQGVPPQPSHQPAQGYPGVRAPIGADGGRGSVAHGERPGAART